MVAYADLILPDTTYLERHDCISLLGPADFRARRGRGCDPLAGGGT
jgi:anaerobic selenocysteine-containing dehydrogenase